MPALFEIKDKSIFVPGANIYIDAIRRKEKGFISHAHIDHIARHRKIFCSKITSELIQLRLKKPDCVILPFSEHVKIENTQVTLFPAGHILGSAQIYIETGYGNLLYTGDFRIKESRTAEEFIYKKCDILIMETTFGMPQYVFPEREEIEEELLHILKERLQQGYIPVVFAYSLGKGQEAMHIIGNSGLPLAVDYMILRYAGIYEKNGINFGTYEKLKRSDIKEKVLLFPAHLRNNKFIKDIPNKYTIYLSGWGMDNSAQYRFGVDKVLPLSDHADFNEMVEFVEKIEPREIYCTHGFDYFVSHLRKLKYNAYPLLDPYQFDLFS